MSKVVGGKNPPALPKLSRPKKTDSSKQKTSKKANDPFNESDDFVASSNKIKKISSKQTTDKNCVESVCPRESSTVMASSLSSDNLPKCRFCGKSFLIGQELKW